MIAEHVRAQLRSNFMNQGLPGDYQRVSAQNKESFMEMLREVLPELHILAIQMEKSMSNPVILFHVISHMAEIANGTGYGQIHIVIEDGIAKFVRGEHSTKLNEPVIKGLETPRNSIKA